MHLLLDSHILVWSILAPEKLSPRERSALENRNNRIYYTPVSLTELFHKESKGKLSLPDQFPQAPQAQGFEELKFSSDQSQLLRTLPLIHSDPFDRMIAAQTIHENLVLMTRDRILRQYPLTLF